MKGEKNHSDNPYSGPVAIAGSTSLGLDFCSVNTLWLEVRPAIENVTDRLQGLGQSEPVDNKTPARR